MANNVEYWKDKLIEIFFDSNVQELGTIEIRKALNIEPDNSYYLEFSKKFTKDKNEFIDKFTEYKNNMEIYIENYPLNLNYDIIKTNINIKKILTIDLSEYKIKEKLLLDNFLYNQKIKLNSVKNDVENITSFIENNKLGTVQKKLIPYSYKNFWLIFSISNLLTFLLMLLIVLK